MRGATFALDEETIDEDEDPVYGQYNARTDSYELDPYTLKGASTHFRIGALTETVAKVLFPDASPANGDWLAFYTEQSADDIEKAWRKVLAEHDGG